MQDVMIDIETLDVRPTAVILSIGAVRFDAQGDRFGDSFHIHVDIDSNLDMGRTVSGSTIMWWLDQNEQARQRLVEAKRVTLPVALHRLSKFITDQDRVWGNGAAFDNVILADAYRACGIQLPWRFWNDRCYRTLAAQNKHIPKTRTGVAHDALDDAITQAQHLQQILGSGDKEAVA